VPALVHALSDPDEDVRANAATALGHIGPEARAAVSDLAKLLTDGHRSVRKRAARALQQIDPAAAARHLGVWWRFRLWLERS
jgi:HEAT repeat protein